MKRNKMKNVKISISLIIVMVILTSTGSWVHAQIPVKYGKDYTIGNILSDYQYFTKGDLTAGNGGHTVGAVAVGGSLDASNTIGDGQVAASYVKHIENILDFSQSQWITNGYKVKELYYDTVSNKIQNSYLMNRFTENPGYIDFQAAFANLEKESGNWADNGKKVAYDMTGTVLTINLEKGKDTYVTIPYSVLSTASKIVLAGLDSVQDFVDNKYIISFTGINSNDYTMLFYNVYFNNDNFNQKLKQLANGFQGDQINLDGMKLVWNFPDATKTLTMTGLSGHVVAPKADLLLNGGNFEGGIIANNVTTDAEGHYYTFYKPGTTPETSSPSPSQTPTTTPTVVPTTTPTVVPTTTPTVAPTTTPTVAPTTTPTVAPTTTPTVAPTTTPTVGPTTIPTVLPTPTPTPTVGPTTIPTVLPTPTPTVGPTTTPTVAPTTTPTVVPTTTPTIAPSQSTKEPTTGTDVESNNNSNNNDSGVLSETDLREDNHSNLSTDNTIDETISPKTGETSPLGIFVIIGIFTAIALIYFSKKKVNHNHNNN